MAQLEPDVYFFSGLAKKMADASLSSPNEKQRRLENVGDSQWRRPFSAREIAPQRPAAVLACFAVLAPQLLGGAIGSTALVIYGLASLACCWVLFELRHSTLAGEPFPVFALGAFFAASWTLMQALPLPCSWIGWAQYERRQIIDGLVALGVVAPHYCTISMAPGSTLIAGATAAALAALAVASTAVARAGGRAILLRGIALSSIAMACVTLAHWAAGASAVFGLYAPVFAKPRLLLAPLLNGNHLAGHMVLGWPLCVSLGLGARRIDSVVAWLVGALLVFTVGLLSLSRGGTGTLLTAGGAFAVTAFARRAPPRRLGPLLLATGGMLLAGGYATYDRVLQELSGADSAAFSKLTLLRELLPILARHPFTGIGRGALDDASVHVLSANSRATHTENLPTQWLIEWGVPCTLVLAAALVASIWSWRRERMRGHEVALACGLFGLCIHNLFDFSLELPGLATTAAVAYGCLAARERPLRAVRRLTLRGALVSGCVGAVVSTIIAMPWLTRWSKSSLHAKIEDAIARDPSAAEAPLRRAFLGYPLDPAFVLLGAAVAVRKAQADTGRWLNLSMQLAPGWAGPHRLAAEVFERRGALEQAAIELSLAATRDPGQTVTAACEFVRRHPSVDLAWAAASEGTETRKGALEWLAGCFGHAWSPQAQELLRRTIEEYPRSLQAHTRYVDAALALQEYGTAAERAHAAMRALPGEPAAVALLARTLALQGHAGEALELIERQLPALRASFALMSIELQACAKLGLAARFEGLLGKLLAEHGRTTAERASVHSIASEALAANGNPAKALFHARTAYDLTRIPSYLEDVHRLALITGSVPAALRSASELCQLGYRPDTYCRKSAAPAHH